MDFKALAARVKMQDEAKAAIRKANYRAAAIITVGGGKGKLMIDLVLELMEKQKITKVLYLCDNRRLRDSDKEGFPQELEKWGTPELRKITRCECYQTTCKWENEEWDVVLGDEIDFAMTPVYSNVFFKNKFKYMVLVSGTLTSPKKKLLTSIAPIVFRCNTQDAEQRGIINKTNYYVYNYALTDEESEQYRKLTRKLAMVMLDDGSDETKKFWTMKRKEFLSNLESSVKHTRRVMRWLWNRNKQTRVVIFCQRTEQADKVCGFSFHGQNEKEDNLSKFQTGEISAISVVAKIKRGINLKNANTGLFEALDGSTTEFEQRNGRLKRLPMSEIANIIFMCPWYKTENGKYKTTVVNDWIGRATGNLRGVEITDLKIDEVKKKAA